MNRNIELQPDMGVAEADYPRLYTLGRYAARAAESDLVRITYFDHNPVGGRVYLDRLGFTFVFRRLDETVNVALSGDMLISEPDSAIINLMARRVDETRSQLFWQRKVAR